MRRRDRKVLELAAYVGCAAVSALAVLLVVAVVWAEAGDYCEHEFSENAGSAAFGQLFLERVASPGPPLVLALLLLLWGAAAAQLLRLSLRLIQSKRKEW